MANLYISGITVPKEDSLMKLNEMVELLLDFLSSCYNRLL